MIQCVNCGRTHRWLVDVVQLREGLVQPVLLYDHSGHNFTCELARSLSRAGIPITYAYTSGVTSPRGRLNDADALRIVPLGRGRRFERYKLPQRVWGEIRLGLDAIRLAQRSKSRHVITCNMPVIVVSILGGYCVVTGRRRTVWFQDSQAGIAAALIKSSAALKAIRLLEGWGLRAADRVIAISPAMVSEATAMGTKPERIRLLPNWAPITQMPELARTNSWSVEHALTDRFVYLYSGTLGLKHSPDRLLALGRWIRDASLPAVVLVVSEGPVADDLVKTANIEALPILVKPFQPAESLASVLATADVCVVLLEAHASEFSAPSKVWSYMCAARPILASMPYDNEAARVIEEEARAGLLADPTDEGDFLAKAVRLHGDTALRSQLGRAGRAFAEARFDEASTTARFADAAGLSLP